MLRRDRRLCLPPVCGTGCCCCKEDVYCSAGNVALDGSVVAATAGSDDMAAAAVLDSDDALALALALAPLGVNNPVNMFQMLRAWSVIPPPW